MIERRRRERERIAAGRDQSQGPQEGGIQAGELRAVIDDELGRLPDRYRSALVLCDLEGRTHEQAAEQLRCPVGTVKSRLCRGRERLRSRLSRRGLAPTAAVIAATLATGQVLAIPAELMRHTIRGAAAHAIAAEVCSAGVTYLVQGATISMAFSKMKPAAILALTLLLGLGGTALLIPRAPAGMDPQQPSPSSGQAARTTPQQAPAGPPVPLAPAERFVLENGLTVYLRPIAGSKQTSLVVLYAVGESHDPAGRSGLSHLAEHVYLMAAAGKQKARTVEEFSGRYPDGPTARPATATRSSPPRSPRRTWTRSWPTPRPA